MDRFRRSADGAPGAAKRQVLPHTCHSEHPLGSAQVDGKKGDLWHPSEFNRPNPTESFTSCRSLRRPDLGET